MLEARLRAPKKSKYSQNLEKLQRELQSSDPCLPGTSSSLHDIGAKARRSLSDSENRLGSSDSEISDDDNYDNDIIPGAIPPGQQIIGSESEDEEEDEFIVEDEEDDGIELPLEFSMKSHSDLSHHFKSKSAPHDRICMLLTAPLFIASNMSAICASRCY